MCDVFEYIVKLDDACESRIWGRDVLSDTAKRLIDKVKQHETVLCSFNAWEFNQLLIY